jgi:DNA repair photolyase
MTLITPFDPWKNNHCTCPVKYSLSAYTGCGHGCLYCYASSYIRDFPHPRPKKDLLKRLLGQLKKIPKNSIITMANSSDPYQELEKKLKLSRNTLAILKDFDIRLNIVTKSPLVTRDLDLLTEFKNITVSFTLTSLDEKITKRIEPSLNYTPQEKLKAISVLSKNIPVAARFDPLIYPLNTENIKKMIKALKQSGARQIITSTYKTKPDNLKRMSKAFPEYAGAWETLYLKTGEKINGYNYLPLALRIKIIEEVRKATLSEGLKFSSCREGFPELNTANCDGTSLF